MRSMGKVEDKAGGGSDGDGDFIGEKLGAVKGDKAIDTEGRGNDEGSEGAMEADSLAGESIDTVLDSGAGTVKIAGKGSA